MAAKGEKGDDQRPIIIIKKIKKVAGGHHGGAWKVAYADFVTAMMAFFLLLWLLNVTTEEQKKAIADYFDPSRPTVSESTSGAGGVMGGTTMATQGAMQSNVQDVHLAQNSGANNKDKSSAGAGAKDIKSESTKKLEEELRKREEKRFETAKAEIEKKLNEDPQLAELKKHLMMDITPEGLRIQIVDQDGDPMFASGSAQMFEKTRKLIALAAQVIQSMPNPVSVRGHTDSAQYKPGSDYTNWELSADRANATRRVLHDAGIPDKRLSNVMGKADTQPLFKDKPNDPQNRRISIILEREDMNTLADREGKDAAKDIGETPADADTAKDELKKAAEQPAYKHSSGDVYFP